jgi:hypothetical protein
MIPLRTKGKGRNARAGHSFHGVKARGGASRDQAAGSPRLGSPFPGIYTVLRHLSHTRLFPTILWHPAQMRAPQALHLVTALTLGWNAQVATRWAATGGPGEETGAAPGGGGAACGGGGAVVLAAALESHRCCSSREHSAQQAREDTSTTHSGHRYLPQTEQRAIAGLCGCISQ